MLCFIFIQYIIIGFETKVIIMDTFLKSMKYMNIMTFLLMIVSVYFILGIDIREGNIFLMVFFIIVKIILLQINKKKINKNY